MLLPEELLLALRFADGFSWSGEAEGLLVGFFLMDCADFSVTLDLSISLEELEALLLLEVVPEDDADELPELERERDLLELPALLCDEELYTNILVIVFSINAHHISPGPLSPFPVSTPVPSTRCTPTA